MWFSISFSLQRFDGWHIAIWCSVHRALFRAHGHLAEPILLSVRVSISSVLHIGCKLRSNFHCDDLFPAVWRGLKLLSAFCKICIKRLMDKSVLFSQDYRWWWRSFIISGGSAFYILLYSIFYFFTKLSITEFIPTLLYLGYTGNAEATLCLSLEIIYFFKSVCFCSIGLMVLTFWLLTGSIGFFAAYSFIRKIYGAVKID